MLVLSQVTTRFKARISFINLMFPISTYVCITCRLGSSRLPNKALRLLNSDLCLLQFLLERLLLLVPPQNLILCTTSEPSTHRLVEISNAYSIKHYIGSADDVMLRILMATQNLAPKCTNIVRVTGDNPLTDPFILQTMLTSHIEESLDYSYTTSIPRGTRVEIINRDYMLRLYNRIQNKNNTEYMTFYFANDLRKSCKDHFFDYEHIPTCFSIDWHQDLRYVRRILSLSNDHIAINMSTLITAAKSIGHHHQINNTLVPPKSSFILSS